MAQKAGGLVYAASCGDCRDVSAVRRLLGGRKVNLVVTSPPYASQRKYDAASGFKPIAPDEYVSWFKEVAEVIGDILAPDGSYFLKIKEHAEDGERSLYVKDLVLAGRIKNIYADITRGSETGGTKWQHLGKKSEPNKKRQSSRC